MPSSSGIDNKVELQQSQQQPQQQQPSECTPKVIETPETSLPHQPQQESSKFVSEAVRHQMNLDKLNPLYTLKRGNLF